MKLSDLLKNIKVLSNYADTEITGVTDDSRKVTTDCAFVCIEGAKFDGHNAARAAVEAGAAAVIAQKETGAVNQVLVKDSREAYSLICASFFGNPADKLTLVGVTGTNGKTTTCFLLKDIFESVGIKTGLIGTIKNVIGDRELEASLTTPDSFELQGLFAEMVKQGCTHCVMEVSSQALAQQRVAGVYFAAAVFTNLTRDHLDYHGDFESYKAAKHILFEQAGLAVINMDDDAANDMMSGLTCPCVTYSAKTDTSDYTAKNIHLKQTGVEYELVGKNVIGRVQFGVPGTFSVYNSMGAAVCAAELGIPFRQVLDALSESKGIKGRIEVVPTNTEFTVIIDYAHSPDGLENILNALRELTQGRIITVFGCGGDRDKTKRPLMGETVARLSDYAIVTSDNPRSEPPGQIIKEIISGMDGAKIPVIVEEDRTLAIKKALAAAKKDDIVLLAGKGHETYQILNTGKIHFDEREKVAELLEKKN